jgi:hypothetical protein
VEWVSGALAIGCLAVGVLHLFRLAVLRGDVAGEASYAAMGIGMAAMFSPVGDPVPAPVWIAVFICCGMWVVLRGGADVAHHVVGSATMLFMLISGHAHGSVAAIVLAAYFAWHVLRCVDRLRAATEADSLAYGSAAVALRVPHLLVTELRAARTAAVAHLVMSVAMALMLLSAV